MLTFQLQRDEAAQVDALVRSLTGRYGSIESADLHRESRTYAQELPVRLRRALNDYRGAERSGVLVISGWTVDDGELGPTPEDWRRKSVPSATLRHDVMFFLMAALLGDPIAWATQQDGLIMHDVFPMRGFEHEQIGWGSEETLVWHTEDAFHPLRTDYLGLMCLRNPDGVETTVADVADVDVDGRTRALLAQEQFLIVPDEAHRAGADAADDSGDARVARLRRRSVERVERAFDTPEPVAVLFGDPDSPYVRIDPHYMRAPESVPAREALAAFTEAIDAAMSGVVLRPGDIVFLDNYRVVHGRKPFRARFDGTDRWLRRLNVARDLRKSRASRLTAESRVIY